VNEAMACGKAVIVSNRCGCASDLVKHNENGFTFDPFNVNQLRNNMDYFLQNPAQTIKFGIESEKIIAGYHPKVVAREMLLGFAKVCTK
jgi:glycosyltransferase involved in cell wall biosynthesis